jgi:hypothetical protein
LLKRFLKEWRARLNAASVEQESLLERTYAGITPGIALAMLRNSEYRSSKAKTFQFN